MIDDAPLRFRGEVYHGYHFNCTACGVELDSTAREVKSRPGFAANDMVSWIVKMCAVRNCFCHNKFLKISQYHLISQRNLSVNIIVVG